MVWAQQRPRRSASASSASCTLASAVCAYYDIHHGLNTDRDLAVWTYNQPAAVEKYADIATAMRARTRAG